MRVPAVLLVGFWLLAAAGVAASGRPGPAAPAGDPPGPLSRRCGYCHSLEYAQWSAHAHSRFLADPRREPRAVAAH